MKGRAGRAAFPSTEGAAEEGEPKLDHPVVHLIRRKLLVRGLRLHTGLAISKSCNTR